MLWILLFDAIHNRYSYHYKLMTGVYVYNVSCNKYPISKNNDLVTVYNNTSIAVQFYDVFYVVSDNF